ncbi:MAG: HAMP domain-containing histidine kinase [Bacteroidia bacterium]|nr:HAMP domain-containing histidine kinase [Bacteroidia bacterium]
MQIRTRLSLQFMLVVTIILISGFGIIYYSSAQYRESELYRRLENKAITSAEIFIFVEQIDSTMLRIFDRTQKDKIPFEVIRIFNDDGREVYSSSDSTSFAVTEEYINEVKKKNKAHFADGLFEIIGLTYSDNQNRFVVFAGGIDLFGRSKLGNLRQSILILLAVLISIVAVSGWVYAGRALKPLSNVIDEVKKLDVDKMEVRLHQRKSRDEIGRLTETFNSLLGRIENAFRLQKIFVSGASHELKNPLTSITSQLQVVLMNDRSNEQYKEILTSILEDIKNLNRTTRDLIEYARLNYENEVGLKEVRIDDVLWFCKDTFQKNNPNCKVNLSFTNMPEDEQKLILMGNEGLLHVAFINFIDNACKFSQNKTCHIQLEVSNIIKISFRDEGIGLDPEEIKLIFEPFYRSNNTAEIKGHGIGLALTKKILDLHGCPVKIESRKNVGSIFTLNFQPKF